MVPDRIRITERAGGLNDGVYAVQLGATIVAQIVHDIGGEQLTEAIEVSVVDEVPVQADELVNHEPILGRESFARNVSHTTAPNDPPHPERKAWHATRRTVADGDRGACTRTRPIPLA